MTKLHEIAKNLKVLAKSVPAATKEADKAHKNTQTPREVFRLLGVANQIERLNERAQAILTADKAVAKEKPAAKAVAKKAAPVAKKPVKAAPVVKAPKAKAAAKKAPKAAPAPVAVPADDEV